MNSANKNTKKWIIIGAVLLILCTCAIYLFSDPMTYGKRQEIKEAWSEYQGKDFTNHIDFNRRYVCGLRYYGTFSDYVILFENTQLTVVSNQEIGDETFACSSSFVIYAYRDGEFRLLEEVFNEGEISPEQLKKIAEIHREYLA